VFIRRKRNYYYLVDSHREDGKVKQRHLAYLGHHPDLGDALMAHAQAAKYWAGQEGEKAKAKWRYHKDQAAKLRRLFERWLYEALRIETLDV